MPRPKKQPQDKVKKDAFSGPRYLIAAAKTAAGVEQGNDFSPWVVNAIREKLDRERPGLIEETRKKLQTYPEPQAGDLMAAEDPPEKTFAARAIKSLGDKASKKEPGPASRGDRR